MTEITAAPSIDSAREQESADYMRRDKELRTRLYTEQADLLLNWNLTARTAAEIEQARLNIETVDKLFV